MANETNKKTTTEGAVENPTAAAANRTVREYMESIENLPRTDGLTLPAISLTEIDGDTIARMRAIATINSATDPNAVVDETGRTLQQVRNEFEFGVSDTSKEVGKHNVEVVEEDGKVGIKITAPEINGVESTPITVVSTPANIAPVDANAPHNPVEAREQAGEEVPEEETKVVEGQTSTTTAVPLNERGSANKGTTTTSPAVLPSVPSNPVEDDTK